MAEEPTSNEEWSEEDDAPKKSLMDRAQELRSNIQKRLAKGSVFTFVLVFVFGIFFGIAAKSVASRSILIGYWDYTITPQEKAAVNLNAVQQEIAARQEEASKSQKENVAPATDNTPDAAVSNGDAPAGELSPLPPTPESSASSDAGREYRD